MNGHFLDYAATCPEVKFPIDTSKQWRNPNAAYAYEERKVLMDCENRIKAAIGAKCGHMLYFRCATEALEWLEHKSIDVRRITWWAHSPYEHDAAVYGRIAKPDELDIVDFFSYQLVNQLTGEIHDIKAVHEQLLQYDEVPFLICDCTAAIGKTSLTAAHVCDYANAVVTSGHKCGCPDIAFMWIDNRLFDWLGGGKDIRNQWGLHHGSISVGHVLALTEAVEWACDEFALDMREQLWMELYSHLINSLRENDIHGFAIHSTLKPDRSDANEPANCTLAINAIRLNGLNADALQQYCASKGVYIGVGASACAGAHDYRVLVGGYKLTEQEASEVIRVSFDENSTIDDVDALIDCIKEYREKFC